MHKLSSFYSRIVRLNLWSRLSVGIVAGILVLATTLAGGTLQASTKSSPSSNKSVQLLMFEQEGCHYCELWDSRIGTIYGKTPEGKFAPLKKLDIHLDDDMPNVAPVIFTPTFVLYKNGHEVGRLTGYISDDFFWGMLSPLITVHGYDTAIKGKQVSERKGRIN